MRVMPPPLAALALMACDEECKVYDFSQAGGTGCEALRGWVWDGGESQRRGS